MFRRLTGMLLEAAGAHPRASRPSGDIVVFDRAAGGFVTRPRPERITRWNEADGCMETIDAWWDDEKQVYVPVHGACIPPAESGRSERTAAWSPADEARRLARESPRENSKFGGK